MDFEAVIAFAITLILLTISIVLGLVYPKRKGIEVTNYKFGIMMGIGFIFIGLSGLFLTVADILFGLVGHGTLWSLPLVSGLVLTVLLGFGVSFKVRSALIFEPFVVMIVPYLYFNGLDSGFKNASSFEVSFLLALVLINTYCFI